MSRQYDVIVTGAGPAGFAAAVKAARDGARTLLVDKNPFAGGTWTAGGMSLIIDHANKAGLMGEIREHLSARGLWVGWPTSNPEWAGLFPVEPMKMLLEAH